MKLLTLIFIVIETISLKAQNFNGPVGIGTQNPVSPLHVSHFNDAFGLGITVTNTSYNPTSLSGYAINNASNGRVGQFTYVPNNYPNQDMKNTVQVSSVGNVGLSFVASADVAATPDIFFQSGSNAHAIHIAGATGRVGLGTSAPAAALHIVTATPRVMLSDNDLTLGIASEVWGRLADFGTNYPQLGLNNANYRGGYFRIDTRDGYDHEFLNLKHLPVGGGVQTIFNVTTSGTGKFASRLIVNGGTNESPTYNENGLTALQVNGGGFFADKVGIGINNPTEMLSVYGNIKCMKIKVTQSAWPDYVFEPGYKLNSLDSVETYIRLHKHLPGVQSAEEIENSSLDIGENQAILLKKVEELTLYMLQLKKDYMMKIDEQNKKIASLEMKLNIEKISR